MSWLIRQIKIRQARRQRYAAALAEGQRLVDQWHEDRGVRA